MQLLLLWFLGLGWLRSAFADLTFTSPLSSSVFTATTGITVAWQGSTAGAPISQLGATTFYLCSGSTASSTTLMTLTAGISPGTTTTFTSGEIDPAKGPSGKYYFITAKTTYQNADVYYYSDYFTINGLTGGFASSVISALSAAGMWAATSTLSTSAASTSTTDVATTAEASSVTEVGSMALS
ncbi:KRE9 family cell wall biosynthesis protein [Schizosaccharomyces japonicus yFS275]|uniref:KRE9 family cell wall biosynthesis protein n=1 Tax=Schizosaccharomyces japonicus (strain yFS275 / FY16936) TaxID=402676 RepID=B6K5U7_SCHJY|nr:KRE9 family cell wall biosynthesis protein [Schizosaccharomyces japonicus yFS275]EEB08901.2 KRE9 family cell wall biosynthesis protein [Schizosaccharomyces japonicus yFS275]